MFLWILTAVLALEALLSWWWLSRLRRLVGRRFFAYGVMAGAVALVFATAWFVASRLGWLPEVRALTSLGLLWGLLGIPFGIAPCLLAFGLADAVKGFRAARRKQKGLPPPVFPDPVRRQMLAAGLAAAPMLATYAGAGVAMAQARDFRRRRLRVPVPGLPPALAGLRVVHVSDTHVGGCTPTDHLDAIAAAVAQEKPDLILFTGDLVDHSNRALPPALEFCERLRAIAPLFFCEGNHDRIDNALELRQALWARKFDWLVDGDSRTIELRGGRVQILGAPWSHHPEEHAAGAAQAAKNRDAGAFPFLLVHHPNAFDAMADAGFPLVLSGHTHGGQLMLSERLGAGPVMFRYWSGLYRKPGSSMVVSNGVGNWFPLRVNAPAEIGVLELAVG